MAVERMSPVWREDAPFGPCVLRASVYGCGTRSWALRLADVDPLDPPGLNGFLDGPALGHMITDLEKCAAMLRRMQDAVEGQVSVRGADHAA